MTHQIMSPQFSTLLRCECTAFAKHVEHFVELLFEFTISNQELALFDQNSEYVSRREYRRRLSNMNFVPLSNDMDEEEISMEDENYFPMNNRNGSRFTTDNRISPSYFHFMAAYTDALMSLQRFILILETTDETLSQADERVLVDTVDELVETYAQHRHRVQNRHGNSSQLENADRQNSVVMSDAGNEQSGNSEDRVPVARPADARQSRRRPYRLINVETLAEALTSNSVLSRNPEQRRRVLDSFLGSFDSMLAENYFIGTSVAPLPSVSSTSNAVIDSGELNTLDGDDDDNDSDDEDNEIMVVDSSLLTRENGHASNSGSDIGMDDIPRNQSDGGHENTNMC
ncbi:unnamed protein product [Thelazia callipaeda]|uniref:GIT domain-containing protein n=1 Tax=Thelazia callipaeda TaxID=103827 RepID=A0A0N5DAR5_THECL|nr:unnamed protein product [Thelazia callipaeda]